MKRLIAIPYVLLIMTMVSGLDVKEGRMKVSIQDASGKFVISYLKSVDKEVYVPLIFDQDPRTTQIVLSLDGKTYKLGETTDFRAKVMRSATGAVIEYRSSFFVFKISISFIKSKTAPLADGTKFDFELENISEKDVQAGVKFLVDTYLGENSKQHFFTQGKPKVQEETQLNLAANDAFWVSPGETGIALQSMLETEGVTKPDSIVFANWKRLHDAGWNYDSVQGRTFDLLPYSINDSAVAMWYNPLAMARAQKRTITLALGNFNENAFSLKQAEKTKTDALFTETVLQTNSIEEKRIAVQTDLIALKDLISQLDQKIATGGTEEDIAVLRQILERFKKRKESY